MLPSDPTGTPFRPLTACIFEEFDKDAKLLRICEDALELTSNCLPLFGNASNFVEVDIDVKFYCGALPCKGMPAGDGKP